MFAAERWAWAFVNALGDDHHTLEEGLGALKFLIPRIQKIPGVLSGSTSASQLEHIIRRSMESAKIAGGGTEYACRLLVLMVKKGRFTPHNAAALLAALETLWDRENGVLVVRVDSAFPLDAELQEALKERVERGIGRKWGAREIKLIPRIVPELLGGYRLQIGSESVDASLRFLLQKMAVDLQRVPSGTSAAGGVAW